MDKYESISSLSDQQTSWRLFTVLVILSQVLGLAAVILIGVWISWLGGFAWQENPALEFNYHPLFMVLGMVFLYGDAIMVYRVFRGQRKMYIKVLHAMLQVFALIFAGVGLKAVFDSHNLPLKPMANMYSLHSWLGIITVVLFGLQWVFGFVTFLFPGLPTQVRGLYKPVHVYWGIGIFCLAVTTALTGITEKAFFNDTEYVKKGPLTILINCLGLTLVALGLTVVYVLTRPEYQRQTLPEEEHIQLTRE